MTLSELQREIKDVLAENFIGGVWVVAEIGDLKVNATSGHCYLELVEKGGDNGVPKARASAAIWRTTWGMLSAHFTGTTGEELRAGMKVLMKAAVTYHELYGLSLNITDIDPLYTLGDMEQQKQKTIAQLQEDGVFDLNRELPIPEVPQRLAVISSPNAAGYQDFINELTSGGYYFSVMLYEAVMQGHGAEASIIDALGRIADDCESFDAVVIIRGGGSQTDLSFLNSYLLCFHIAQFPLPIIAGLGHDKDQSIVDMVAALSLKTPTAVAGFLTQSAANIDYDLDQLDTYIRQSAESMLLRERQRLQTSASALLHHSTTLTRNLELRMEQLRSDVIRRQENILLKHSTRLEALSSAIADRASAALKASQSRLDVAEQLINSRDPKNILVLGFAIVRANGHALRDASQVTPGQHVEITLHKGKLKAKTE